MAAVVLDARNLQQTLRRFAKRADDPRSLKTAADFLVDRVDQKFEDEGPGWEPLKASTMKTKTGDMLEESGALRGSIDKQVSHREIEVFSTSPYAEYHVDGTDTIPARDFLDILDDSTMERVSDLILDEVLR